ncbi:MAG: PP2C family protein-serine/threonine phosphatase [Bacteroidetes bacterium]|nr:PP2C family protein-serine/threonine phosphatase [Bacteroidota bacterium]
MYSQKVRRMAADYSHSAYDIISDSAALLELSTVLNASTDLDFILGNILLSSMGKLMVSRGVVLLDADDQIYRVRSVKGFSSELMESEFTIPVGWNHVVAIPSLKDSPDPSLRHFAQCCESCALDIIIPMLLEDRMVGIIGLGKKITGKEFASADLTFLESVAAVAATAVRSALSIENLRLVNRRLDTKIQEMNTLFEISREMNTTFIPDDILRILSYALMGQLRVLRYAVFTQNDKGLEPVVVRLPEFTPNPAHQEALEELRETIVFSDRRAPEKPHEQWLFDAGLTIVLPMMSQHRLRGVLCLGERVGGASFDRPELEYLHALANITISALENARLVKDTIDKQRMEQELSVAKTIQKGLLPKSIPTPDLYQIAAINESSQQVGGDYYDVITISDHEYVLAIADVSGKGVPASLLMANVQAALRTIAPLQLPMPEATARINAIIHTNTAADKFITFFWGLLDTQKHTFTYVNAGHNPPYLVHADGSMLPLQAGGLILGIMQQPPPYSVETVQLRSGDAIVCYTDGVNEAMSKDMEEFSDERLQKLLTDHLALSADDLLQCIRDEIVSFTLGAAQSDDITMLIVRRCS